MKLIGKLQDGTVFLKKGHDEEELFEFKTDEGKLKHAYVLPHSSTSTLIYLSICFYFYFWGVVYVNV